MHVGIIGAGHAGVEAARVLRQKGAMVTVFSAESVLPYYRPRLVALAFGQAEFPAIQLHPEGWYKDQHIDLRLNTRIEKICPERCEVAGAGFTHSFDGLILALGAVPVIPPIPSAGSGGVLHPLWTYEHALTIRSLLSPGGEMAVLGGGILGIEAALRAIDAGMRVTIVERMDRLMPAQFGDRASRVLKQRLMDKGINIVLGHGICGLGNGKRRQLCIGIDDGSSLDVDFCLVSIGARPETSLAKASGLTLQKGLAVNSFLQTSHSRAFGAGDVVQFGAHIRCSMREATLQGAMAAANLYASMTGAPLQPYRPESLPLMFKTKDFELYSIGEPGGIGYEEHLLEGTSESVIRSLVMKDGIPLGVQMIGTRQGFDDYVVKIKQTTR